MIDIHSHIAWNIDDGMPTKEDAVKSLVEAYNDGIRAIVSTPHLVPGQLDSDLFYRITMRQKELKDLSSSLGVQVYYGGEMFMNQYFANALEEGLYRTMNGTRYLLVEYDVRRDIHDIDYREDTLYEVTIHDMVPVIAHVERYFHKGIDKNIIQQWFDVGYVIQVNRTSILGYNGKQMQKNALWLLDNGYVHCVATDTHRAEGVRVEKLSDVKEFLTKRYGEENANLLLYKNPYLLLSNKKPLNMEKKKSLFSWLG